MVQSGNFGETHQKLPKRGPILSNQISNSLIFQIIRRICLKLFLDTICSETRVIAGSNLISNIRSYFRKKLVAVSVSAFDSSFLRFRL